MKNSSDLRKPNSVIALLVLQNISPLLIKGVSPLRPFGQRFNNLERAALLASF